jgi:hypothetical protein
MQKSAFKKIIPFALTMTVGIFVAGLFSSESEVPVGHHDVYGNYCDRDAEEHKESHYENEELRRRVIELEQRLEAVEGIKELREPAALTPEPDHALPIS